jgi:ATP-dependent RNA helicase DeaD
MAYDQTRPAWLQTGVDPEEDAPCPKPKLTKRRGGESSGDRKRSSWNASDNNSEDEGRRVTPKPKLRTRRDASMSSTNQKLGSNAARE